MEIKIASINCNSFRCEIKQASILSFLNANNVNIVCLQETFMDSMHYKKAIKDKWSCEVFMSPAPQNNSCGVAILVKQNLNLNILKIFNDAEGRLVFIDFLIQEKAYRLINIYSPTNATQRKEFFKFVSIFTDCNKSIILAGDFNMIESVLDKRGGNLDNGFAGKSILSTIQDVAEMKDAFRYLYPRKWEYSWHSTYHQVFVRIDRIYVAKNMLKSVKGFSYMAISGPDHLAAICTLKDISLHTNSIGRGVWRIDETILEEQAFGERLSHLWHADLMTKNDLYSLEWWESCKAAFKDLAITYKKEKLRDYHTEMRDLYHSLEMVRAFLRNEGCNQESSIFWNSQLTQLKEIIMEKIKINVTTLKNKKELKNINNNENLTATFLDTYKVSNKQYVKILTDTADDNDYADNINLTRIATCFYTKLFDHENISPEAVEIITSCLNRLSDMERNSLDGFVNTSELNASVNIFRDGARPGSDGLSSKFYKKYIYLFGGALTTVFNNALENGTLSTTQKKRHNYNFTKT